MLFRRIIVRKWRDRVIACRQEAIEDFGTDSAGLKAVVADHWA